MLILNAYRYIFSMSAITMYGLQRNLSKIEINSFWSLGQTICMWKIIHTELKNGKTCDKETSFTSEELNTHFVNIAKNLVSNLADIKSQCSLISSKLDTPVNSFVLENLKNSDARDIYDLNVKVIKYVSHVICVPLVYVINNCIDQGIFPNELKIAKVVPLHKKVVPKTQIILDQSQYCQFSQRSLSVSFIKDL